jgi:hypothetical protein
VLVFATAEGVAAITASATLLGAGGLAYVTVYTTNRRLVEEREKQERELIAEQERLEATLAHDRELADIADLRELLDQAATAIDRAASAQKRAKIGFELPESSHKNALRAIHALDETLEEARGPLTRLSPRLRVRLGSDDPVTMAFVEVGKAIDEMRSVVFARRIGSFDEAQAFEKARAAWLHLWEAVQAFFVTAVERTGTLRSGTSVPVRRSGR